MSIATRPQTKRVVFARIFLRNQAVALALSYRDPSLLGPHAGFSRTRVS